MTNVGRSTQVLRVVSWSLIFALLCVSFWLSAGWLELCAGLAMFLFGMQCLEESLKQLAGGKLEQLLGKSTSTPFKGMLFGIGGTMLLQSSTLVSLLTIAFISSGLIQLAGGIAILLGANLGATSGIWLLALAGQNLSLSPLALPLIALGLLASFIGPKSKAAGRIVLGIAFIFLGIDQIKSGFSDFTGGFDLSEYALPGIAGQLLFIAVGLLITVVLQSSHATLMITLAALGAGQLGLDQSLALAIGANVGSSISTAFVGFLGGNRSGQRLALAHMIFNVVTALLAWILLLPLTWLVLESTDLVGMGENSLIQLALFHTLFNLLGVVVFWPLQTQLANFLVKVLPEKAEPSVLISEEREQPKTVTAPITQTRARYLNEASLASADAAAHAAVLELRHLGRLSLEVICHALYQPVEQLSAEQMNEHMLNMRFAEAEVDADMLYQRHIKGVYADLLAFSSRLDADMDEEQHQFWMAIQVAAMQLVDAVKDAKHLQKNLSRYLADEHSSVYQHYLDLRRNLMWNLRQVREFSMLDLPEDLWNSRLAWVDAEAANFDAEFRNRLFSEVRAQRINSLEASSLMNDVGYASRISQSLRNVLQISANDSRMRALRGMAKDELVSPA